MRKDLLTLVALATASTALAIAPGQQSTQLKKLTGKHSVINKANNSRKVKDFKKADGILAKTRMTKATRAEETLNMQWGYCYDPYTAFQLDDNEINQAIYVAPEITEKFDGAILKNVLTANPANAADFNEEDWTYGNPVKTCTVWVREDLNAEPVVQGTGELGPFGFEWSTIALDESYTIKKGKPFYVGVSMTVPEETPYTYAYSTDYIRPAYDNTNLCYTYITGYDDEGYEIVGEEKKWVNMGFDYGNACIRLDVYGDNLPQNIAKLTEIEAPSYIAPGNKVEIWMSVYNGGANALSEVEISLQYNGEEPQTVKSVMYDYDENWEFGPASIPYGYTGVAIAEFDCPKNEGNYSYTISIPKLNGDIENNDDAELSGYLLCLAEGYHKNVVVEEATGTWCGYCPVGWAGMEYIKEAFAEEGVIGIALHQGDPMAVLDEGGAYETLLDYISGFPSCFYNRNMAYTGYPSPEYLEEELPSMIEIPACASIEAKLTATDNKSVIKLATKSDFLFNGEEGDYEVAYTVIEDGVGPYMQSNYLSGEDDEESYGFGSKPEKCLIKFNDVARNCSKPMGIEGSLPAIEKGGSYEYECEIELDGVKNVDNCRVVAMIINKKSGLIENATVEAYPNGDSTGVGQIASGKNFSFVKGVKGGIFIDGDYSNVSIYSASGMKMAKANGFRVNLPAGIYFVTRGSESVKVVVK